MDLEKLNQYENSFIEEFKNHPVFAGINKLNDREFQTLLLQRRFLSLAFTPVYDIAIDGLSDERAIVVSRKILREEYPLRSPSHREDLVHDLLILGIQKRKILKTIPTSETHAVLQESFLLFHMTEPEEFHDIKTICALRFWGEVLVAEEYRVLVQRMLAAGLDEKNSRFFWPHYKHDVKHAPLHVPVEFNTHSDQLTKVLQGVLESEEKIDYCAKVTQRVFEIKKSFYDQFSRSAEM